MVKIILLAILCALTFVSCRENKKNVSDAEVKNTYSWTSSEGDMMHSASVTLLEDGTFEFDFSPLSSYIGRGDYTIQNDKLILETSDGDFTYTFDMSDDSLIFDGTNSSDFTWYADFTNGAVFTQNSNT